MSMMAATAVSVLRWISDLCTLGAMLGCVYTLFASAFVLGFHPKKKRSPARADIPVSILKPLHGDEPGLSLRLASFFEQDYNAPYKSSSALRMPPIRRLRSRSGFTPRVQRQSISWSVRAAMAPIPRYLILSI